MVVAAPLKLLVGIVILAASLAFMPSVIGPMAETMVLKK
jgi:flagellar biosynthesis protein FliR